MALAATTAPPALALVGPAFPAHAGEALPPVRVDVRLAESEGRDLDASVASLKAGAEVGGPRKQWFLGLLYLNGVGVEQDDAKAVAWLQRSVKQGTAEAAATLGDLHLSGRGVAKDYAEAIRHYNQALRPGFGPSTFGLPRAPFP